MTGAIIRATPRRRGAPDFGCRARALSTSPVSFCPPGSYRRPVLNVAPRPILPVECIACTNTYAPVGTFTRVQAGLAIVPRDCCTAMSCNLARVPRP